MRLFIIFPECSTSVMGKIASYCEALTEDHHVQCRRIPTLCAAEHIQCTMQCPWGTADRSTTVQYTLMPLRMTLLHDLSQYERCLALIVPLCCVLLVGVCLYCLCQTVHSRDNCAIKSSTCPSRYYSAFLSALVNLLTLTLITEGGPRVCLIVTAVGISCTCRQQMNVISPSCCAQV